MSHRAKLQLNFLLELINNSCFKDFRSLNDMELKLLVHFIYSVNNQLPLCGTKKSSAYGSQQAIKTGTTYNVAHYHAVSETKICKKTNYQSCNNYTKCKDIKVFNINKFKESPRIIHYVIRANDIVIFGYSPKHANCFPQFFNNPLVQRVRHSFNNVDYDHLYIQAIYLNFCSLNNKIPNIKDFKSFILQILHLKN